MPLMQQSGSQASFCPANLKEAFGTSIHLLLLITAHAPSVSKDDNKAIMELQPLKHSLFSFCCCCFGEFLLYRN